MSDGSSGLDARLTSLPIAAGDCWNRIGIAGDRSCPELETHIHCRNCPVFASSARAFFDRPAPERYLAEWTQWLAGSPMTVSLEAGASAALSNRDLVSVLIFRLGREWMAFPTQAIAEVTVPRPIHRIPHRSNAILIGLVNLRGQLQLCISLHGLLGLESPQASSSQIHSHGSNADTEKTAATGSSPTSGSRLIVLRDRERLESWICAAEEVLGVHRLPRSQVRSVSSTLANPEVSFSQAILSWEDRSVSFLDEQRVFAALRSIGQ
jgi:chemotaxis-related protein WspD